MKHAATHMRYGGSIINAVTLNAVFGFPGFAAHAVSASSVDGLTKKAAIELAPLGIRVNCILPSSVQFRGENGSREDTRETLISKATPLGRCCEPAEVAAMIHFLAADDCSYLSAQSIHICGAASAGVSSAVVETLKNAPEADAPMAMYAAQ